MDDKGTSVGDKTGQSSYGYCGHSSATSTIYKNENQYTHTHVLTLDPVQKKY
jgi:hypothetical protein